LQALESFSRYLGPRMSALLRTRLAEPLAPLGVRGRKAVAIRGIRLLQDEMLKLDSAVIRCGFSGSLAASISGVKSMLLQGLLGHRRAARDVGSLDVPFRCVSPCSGYTNSYLLAWVAHGFSIGLTLGAGVVDHTLQVGLQPCSTRSRVPHAGSCVAVS
jgi:hypothetical protein